MLYSVRLHSAYLYYKAILSRLYTRTFKGVVVEGENGQIVQQTEPRWERPPKLVAGEPQLLQLQ